MLWTLSADISFRFFARRRRLPTVQRAIRICEPFRHRDILLREAIFMDPFRSHFWLSTFFLSFFFKNVHSAAIFLNCFGFSGIFYFNLQHRFWKSVLQNKSWRSGNGLLVGRESGDGHAYLAFFPTMPRSSFHPFLASDFFAKTAHTPRIGETGDRLRTWFGLDVCAVSPNRRDAKYRMVSHYGHLGFFDSLWTQSEKSRRRRFRAVFAGQFNVVGNFRFGKSVKKSVSLLPYHLKFLNLIP